MINYLFPNVFKIAAWIIMITGFMLNWYGVSKYSFVPGKTTYAPLFNKQLSDNTSQILCVFGFALLLLCKEREEDERTAACRTKAISRAFLGSLIILLFTKSFQIMMLLTMMN